MSVNIVFCKFGLGYLKNLNDEAVLKPESDLFLQKPPKKHARVSASSSLLACVIMLHYFVASSIILALL